MQATIVIKCGGSILNDFSQLNHLISDIKELKVLGYQIVLVHGGGPDINQLCQKFEVANIFKNGLRVTDEITLSLTQMALLGKTNAGLVHRLNQAEIPALGLSGHDLNLLMGDFINQDKLGYVGVIHQVNRNFLEQLFSLGIIPVIAPLIVDGGENVLNVNADLAASAIAVALGSQQLILLSDVDGYYADYPDKTSLVSKLTLSQVNSLLMHDQISSGMIPKLKACEQAISASIKVAQIVNGNLPHGLKDAVLKPGSVGTIVVAREEIC